MAAIQPPFSDLYKLLYPGHFVWGQQLTGTTTSGHNKEVAALTTAQLKTATVFINITVHLPHEWNFHSPQAIKK